MLRKGDFAFGFSILELMIVLAIAGSGLVYFLSPATNLSDKTHFVTFKTDFSSALEQARNWARTRRECVAVSLVGQTLTVQGYLTTAQPCPVPVTSLPLDANSSMQLSLPTGAALSSFTKISSGTLVSPLVFNTQGGTDYADTVGVTANMGVYSSQFQILPLTGQIGVQ